MKKKVLDVCCGSKMFYFDKENENVLFMDNRTLETTLCDGRTLSIRPDIIGDFTNLKFDDESFKIVVFDPPHLHQVGEKSFLGQKYGRLPKEWKSYLQKGFEECFRVLEESGLLIFKWNEEQIKLGDVLKLVPHKPLLGDKRSKTHWLIFIKLAVVTKKGINDDNH